MKLVDRVAIVTGGNRGIGLAISQALAQEGARVVIACREADSGQRAAHDLGGMFVQCDVSQHPQVESLAAQVMQRWSRVDILVNNAAVHAAAPFVEETPELWQEMYTVNVMGTVYPSQAVVPLMRRQGGGRIVHVASKAGVVGEPGHAAYSASKGAVIALTRAMAIELAPDHITVNAVAPGPVLTDMLRGVFPNPVDRQALGAEAPLGRLGRPEDVAGAVLLLASDDADWITGQVINVDGGFSVLK